MNLKMQLFRILGISGIAFFIVGLLINWFFPIPTFTLLVDRSYCPFMKWQQVVTNYTIIYQKHQQRQVELQSVILFSSLGEEQLLTPLSPEVLKNLPTYGQPQLQKQLQLQKQYPQSQLLKCPE